MCFRPPTPAKPVTCPECGAVNPGTLKACIKCKADLTSAKQEADEQDQEQEKEKEKGEDEEKDKEQKKNKS